MEDEVNMHVADTLGIAPYGLPPEDGPSIFRAGRRLSRTGFFVLETLVHGTLANDGRRDEREKADGEANPRAGLVFSDRSRSSIGQSSERKSAGEPIPLAVPACSAPIAGPRGS